jgi:hypothetical protein
MSSLYFPCSALRLDAVISRTCNDFEAVLLYNTLGAPIEISRPFRN